MFIEGKLGKFVCWFFSWFLKIGAIVFPPFIFCRNNMGDDGRRHERIHIQQWFEISLVCTILFGIISQVWNIQYFYWWYGFFIWQIWYGLEWVIDLIRGYTEGEEAYVHNTFEKEASSCQYIRGYLLYRKNFNWFAHRKVKIKKKGIGRY